MKTKNLHCKDSSLKKVYLDFNAGAPLKDKVREALLHKIGDNFLFNPSSTHSYGRLSRALLQEARLNVSQSINESDLKKIVFTSSGTESNQWVIRNVLLNSFKNKKSPRWILSQGEHPSVRSLVPWFKKKGGEVDFLNLNKNGEIEFQQITEIIKEETVLVSCQWAQNETGVIFPVYEIGELLEKQNREREEKIFFHIDAVQAWGKCFIDVNKIKTDFMTFSSHKVGGLAGTGFVWMKEVSECRNLNAPIIGSQEHNQRGGTENLLGIYAIGVAAKNLQFDKINDKILRLGVVREKFEELLKNKISEVEIISKEAQRLPQTVYFRIPEFKASKLIPLLDDAGFCVSAGAACSAGLPESSAVLLAMGLSKQEALEAVRVSFDESILWQDLEDFVTSLKKIVNFSLRTNCGNRNREKQTGTHRAERRT